MSGDQSQAHILHLSITPLFISLPHNVGGFVVIGIIIEGQVALMPSAVTSISVLAVHLILMF